MLLFTLALYLQQGLGHSALSSGLALVPWVAAFGIAGPLLPRLPKRIAVLAAPGGATLLGAAYAGVALLAQAGHATGAALLAVLGAGGLGLGTAFSSLLGHLTTNAPARYAADFSGGMTTILQVSGAVGVATLGTLYLAIAPGAGRHDATHAFALVSACFAGLALLAAVAAHRATRRPRAVAGDEGAVAAGAEEAQAAGGALDPPRAHACPTRAAGPTRLPAGTRS